jgi:hypothetical protein
LKEKLQFVQVWKLSFPRQTELCEEDLLFSALL